MDKHREILIRRAVEKVAADKANWLDDVIGGLLINGVAKDEIHINEHPDRTEVQVRGVPRYEFRWKFDDGSD